MIMSRTRYSALLSHRDINNNNDNNTAILFITPSLIFRATRPVIEISSALGGRRTRYRCTTRCSHPGSVSSPSPLQFTGNIFGVPFLS